jgi:tRNA(Ile)-lysidine synthase
MKKTPIPLRWKLPTAPFPGKARLLVAVSGGSDSMGLLLLLLHEWPDAPRRLIVAHVHYGLRGRDSDRDEREVRLLCRDHQLPFVSLRVKNMKGKARREGRSVQELAREIRYAFFQRLAKKRKAWGVAVAHHREDQSETVLDRLLRGTGARGLSGLRPLQTLAVVRGLPPLRVWRPLLGFSKAQIQAYLGTMGVVWREDRSNQKGEYRRNQIRREVLPFLSRWNERLPEALARLGEITAAEDAFLEGLVDSAEKKVAAFHGRKAFHCRADRFQELPLALKRRLVRSAAEKLTNKGRGLSFERIEETLRIWEGREKGPRDMGFGLSAGRMKNRAFWVLSPFSRP